MLTLPVTCVGHDALMFMQYMYICITKKWDGTKIRSIICIMHAVMFLHVCPGREDFKNKIFYEYFFLFGIGQYLVAFRGYIWLPWVQGHQGWRTWLSDITLGRSGQAPSRLWTLVVCLSPHTKACVIQDPSLTDLWVIMNFPVGGVSQGHYHRWAHLSEWHGNGHFLGK